MEDLIALFSSILPISEQEKSLLRTYLQVETIKKNELYCIEGKICKKLGFVIDGIFKVVRTDHTGKEYIPYFVTKGHFAVAIESYTNHTISEEYIKAFTSCRVLTIDRNTFDMFEKKIANFSKIISLLKERALIEKNNLKSEMLILDAATRYHTLVRKNPLILQYVSQKDISQFLGITQYTLSRIRKKH